MRLTNLNKEGLQMKRMNNACLALTIKIGVLAVALPLLLSPTWAAEPLPKSLALGTSSLGSSVYVQSAKLADILHKYLGIDMTVEAIGGPDANVRALDAGKIQLMTGSSLAPAHAFLGKHAYAGHKVALRLIAQGYFTNRYLIVQPDIKSPQDLRGKLFIGEKPGTEDYRWITDALFKIYGLSEDDVKIVSTGSTKESIAAYRLGRVHGFICGGGTPLGSLLELQQQREFTILRIDDKIDAILAELPPGFTTNVIPTGTYKNVQEDRVQVALRMGFVCRQDLSDEAVYQIAKTFYEHFDEFKTAHKTAKEWGMERTAVNGTLAFHEGAIRYYKEVGVWSPEAERIQKKFLMQIGESK